ncbi:hypothetical protein [Rhodoferax sp.]|uniref:hypothetical protein n=1 Tax=Rhodoferax sp. TaxID=50421 RepID=UPI002744952B|nr:hypothetical protein [Rhodoferax sp.]
MNDSETDARPVPGKYDDVLRPFVSLMERELHANTGKGDRPGWLSMSADEVLLEIYYHVAKLQKAIRNNDGPRIQEHAADVANMAMMALDVCGGIAILELCAGAGAEPVTLPEHFATIHDDGYWLANSKGPHGYNHVPAGWPSVKVYTEEQVLQLLGCPTSAKAVAA